MSKSQPVSLADLMTRARPIIAPRVAKKTQIIETHADLRSDDYFWLREKTNPDVTRVLQAENTYTEAVLAPLNELRSELFTELKARLKDDDRGVPYRHGNYFYYWRMEANKQYAIYCRKYLSLDAVEEVYFDGNTLARPPVDLPPARSTSLTPPATGEQSYFQLGALEVSPDHRWLAYAADFDGSEQFRIFFKNLATGELSRESIVGAGTSLEWAADNQTVYYTLLDAQMRPDRLLCHRVGTNPADDILMYQESDPQFFVSCSKSRSQEFIFLEIEGKITSEIHFLRADQPAGSFSIVEPRRRGVEYSVSHHGERFFIVTNDEEKNFRLVETPIAQPGRSSWTEIRRGSEKLFIEECDSFKTHLILHVRDRGLEQLRILELPTFHEHSVQFAEPTYSLSAQTNAEFDTDTFRFGYSSLVTPTTVIDYHLPTRIQTVRKQQEIPSGYDRNLYRSERLYAKAADGVEIPISIVYRIDPSTTDGIGKDGSHPLYLYGYGSYGISQNASFSSQRLSLIDRGFVFAMAHIRGGSDLGRNWYEDGKFLKKKNTFNDFIAAAEHLTRAGYSREGEIAVVGGSAGGMLVGAVINQRPKLFKAAVAHVPFVDVVNTMLDATLPLTALEYEEWGNPQDPAYYHMMKSYSPYDNVKAQAYPHLLVTSGLNDPRVTYWEPAKWVAKIRELKTSDSLLLHHINMDAGHGGPSGRFESLKEYALEYAFLLTVFGRS